MEGKHNISQYQSRLVKTLSSPDLENEDTLKSLIGHQILQSSQSEAEEYIDNIVEKRTKDLSNLLSMLRSASVDAEGLKGNEAHQSSWKLKQDTHEHRVMYREGPPGTPSHTLLVEGYVDGPLDHCLCVSWEASLYKKCWYMFKKVIGSLTWYSSLVVALYTRYVGRQRVGGKEVEELILWPHFNVQTFKVVSSECVKNIRVGENISLVRMKVSWPLSSREALIHFVEFEFLQDDLVIVLLNSISDLESIERSTHGFTRDGIPDVQNVVRIDVVGGYCVQKVSANRSYFRTIANMDIKLDFVPPAFINFISRQLISSGFKLYQKEVTSLSKGDEDFSKALKEPLYSRLREALYSNKISLGDSEPINLETITPFLLQRDPVITKQPEGANMDNDDSSDGHLNYSIKEAPVSIDKNGVCEIEKSEHSKEDSIYETPTNEVVEKSIIEKGKRVRISLEVKHALRTLEKVISIFRDDLHKVNDPGLLRIPLNA